MCSRRYFRLRIPGGAIARYSVIVSSIKALGRLTLKPKDASMLFKPDVRRKAEDAGYGDGQAGEASPRRAAAARARRRNVSMLTRS